MDPGENHYTRNISDHSLENHTILKRSDFSYNELETVDNNATITGIHFVDNFIDTFIFSLCPPEVIRQFYSMLNNTLIPNHL